MKVKQEVGREYLVHAPIYFPIYLVTGCFLVYEAIYLPVRPKGASELNPPTFPSILPSALIE